MVTKRILEKSLKEFLGKNNLLKKNKQLKKSKLFTQHAKLSQGEHEVL